MLTLPGGALGGTHPINATGAQPINSISGERVGVPVLAAAELVEAGTFLSPPLRHRVLAAQAIRRCDHINKYHRSGPWGPKNELNVQNALRNCVANSRIAKYRWVKKRRGNIFW